MMSARDVLLSNGWRPVETHTTWRHLGGHEVTFCDGLALFTGDSVLLRPATLRALAALAEETVP